MISLSIKVAEPTTVKLCTTIERPHIKSFCHVHLADYFLTCRMVIFFFYIYIFRRVILCNFIGSTMGIRFFRRGRINSLRWESSFPHSPHCLRFFFFYLRYCPKCRSTYVYFSSDKNRLIQ